MALRINPAPGWPTPPEGFVPGPGWQPDPSWPAAPPGWPSLVDDGLPSPASTPRPTSRPTSTSTQHLPASPAYDPAAPAAPPPTFSPQDTRTTNGLAITSFVLSLLGGTAVPIILGVVALRQIERRGQKGRNLARAGIVIGSLMVVVVAIGVTYAITHDASRDSASGEVTRAGSVAFGDLKVGDCLVYPASETFSRVDVTPCGQPHTAQVYLRQSLAEGPYPGANGLRTRVMPICRQGMASAINLDLVSDSMRITYFEPNDHAWASGDRVVNCLIRDDKGTLTTSLLK